MSTVAAPTMGRRLRPAVALGLWTVRESLRRRVFIVVGLLTAGFLGLYALGCSVAFSGMNNATQDTSAHVPLRELVGATLGGLGMFAVLFLGCVLAAFLTLSTVRGDAEQGLLQPLVVRPVGRAQVIVVRWAAASVVCALYVGLVYAAMLIVLDVTGGWTPDHIVGPGFRLALSVAVLAALCVLGSVFMTATANGIAVFMVLGAGLFAGLLGQVGRGIGNSSLKHAANVIAWCLPFESLYQDALAQTTAAQVGISRFLVQLGPFGGGVSGGALLLPYVVAYLAGVGAMTVALAARRDL